MILVTGGTGFVGSHLVKRLASERIQTRCLVRKTSDTQKLKELGIEVAYGDVLDKESLKKAVEDVETVIHLVGIIIEKKGATFEIIHTQGTRNLVDASKAAGVRRFIYISALGARENARSRYHKTKWEAEQAVINSRMEYVIFRPSIMIGIGGEFITMLTKIVRWAPIIPIVDGESKILEIDNPTFQIPITFMWPAACILEVVMEKPPITTQQLTMLQEDNICDIKEMQEVFNLKLVPLKEALQTFLQPKGEKNP